MASAMPIEAETPSICIVCIEPIDYCPGHGIEGTLIYALHDYDNHDHCHEYAACRAAERRAALTAPLQTPTPPAPLPDTPTFEAIGSNVVDTSAAEDPWWWEYRDDTRSSDTYEVQE